MMRWPQDIGSFIASCSPARQSLRAFATRCAIFGLPTLPRILSLATDADLHASALQGNHSGGVAQTMRFFGSLAVASPSRIALVISDWVVGLSMREFARRCLGADASVSTALDRRAASLCAAIGDRLAQGKVTLTWRQAAVPNLVISLNGMVDRHFSRFAVPRLRRLLKHTSISLTLRIGSLPPSQLEEIKRLLRRLSRYGDRISIAADETLREILAVNSSVFNLRLGPPSP